ncbi:MAG: dipeptide ABC transporter ATP-binding protein [Candidatus Competibacteraceae bacterium]|jgi:dipeptide transport system ATP-binding protein|nr:dipeptide ABC transporter ATP-binding protein [Candidatus Competibacteraceae bacterium]
MTLLTINNLSVQFGTRQAPFRAVDGVELALEKGEVVGIVGESGSGKSVMSLAIMGLIDYPGRVAAERMLFADRDLLTLSASERRKLLGKDIAMIFQDPMTSLNPCYTVGFQIMETLKVHEGGSRAELRQRAVQLLEQVGIPDPASRLRAFPHQLSGGMSQRIVIAMAIACNPQLLIADEPTTALDVTIQAQIMDLLKGLQAQRGMALLLITHDLAVVAETCERVVVMYAGQIVETGRVEEVFKAPSHPYTAALLNALPERSEGQQRLSTIAGVVPGQYDRPNGCLLNPRCEFATELCVREQPRFRTVANRQVRCHTPLDAAGRPSHD